MVHATTRMQQVSKVTVIEEPCAVWLAHLLPCGAIG
jgi:hypothetical protein